MYVFKLNYRNIILLELSALPYIKCIAFTFELLFSFNTVILHKFFFNDLVGLEEVEAECRSLDIEFHMLIGNGEEVLPSFIEKNKIGALVIDFMPLRDVLSWADTLKKSLSKDIPLCQVCI